MSSVCPKQKQDVLLNEVVGTVDGTPAGLLNADKIQTMHPSVLLNIEYLLL